MTKATSLSDYLVAPFRSRTQDTGSNVAADCHHHEETPLLHRRTFSEAADHGCDGYDGTDAHERDNATNRGSLPSVAAADGAAEKDGRGEGEASMWRNRRRHQRKSTFLRRNRPRCASASWAGAVAPVLIVIVASIGWVWNLRHPATGAVSPPSSGSSSSDLAAIWSSVISAVPLLGRTLQLAQQASKRNFSKVVVVVVNDQGGDEDASSDDGYASSDDDGGGRKQESNVGRNVDGKKSTTSNGRDSKQQPPQEQQQQQSNGGGGQTSEECQPKDWKCWMDKYNKSVASSSSSSSTSSTAQKDAKQVDATHDIHQDMKKQDDDKRAADKGRLPEGSKSKATKRDKDLGPKSSHTDKLKKAQRKQELSKDPPGPTKASSETEDDSESECAPADWKCWANEYSKTGGSAVNASYDDGSSRMTTQKKEKMRKGWSGGDGSTHEKRGIIGGQKEAIETCQDGNYQKRTLKLAYELPFAALFRDAKGQKIFEASSVTLFDGMAYAVCDSSWAVSMFNPYLEPFGEGNYQVGDPNRESEDSGYEAIFYDNTTFYVVRESILDRFQNYHAMIEQLSLNPESDHDSYEVVSSCPSEFEFDGDSKGFEGATPIHDLQGDLVVLGLCEANHCSESKKLRQAKGNGRLVAMKLESLSDGSCQWATIRQIDIPESAYFGDYSAITMDDEGRVAIASQEESQIWVGHLEGIQPNGLWDIDAMEFRQLDGKVYDFPKNDACQTIYCNIEGVHWLNEDTILAVSDKMKGKGKTLDDSLTC